MVNSFASVGQLVMDLANTTISVITVVVTGDNAGVILTATVIIALVAVFMYVPKYVEKHLLKR